jgi:hypothetical protein
MDIDDISNCLTLMEEALNSDVFKIEDTKIYSDRLLTTFKNKKKSNHLTDSVNSNSTHSNSTHSNSTHSNSTHSNSTHSNYTHSNSTHSNYTHSNSVNFKSENVNSSHHNSSYSNSETMNSMNSSEYKLSGNYSNIQPMTVASELFKNSDMYDTDSNSYYNLAFSEKNKINDTEIDAKIITFRKK